MSARDLVEELRAAILEAHDTPPANHKAADNSAAKRRRTDAQALRAAFEAGDPATVKAVNDLNELLETLFRIREPTTEERTKAVNQVTEAVNQITE